MKHSYTTINIAGDAFDGASWNVTANAREWHFNTFADNITELVYSIK